MIKQLIATLALAVTTVPIILAQDTVSGVVVDKKGNPVPGVLIDIPGTPDQTLSDMDGTFTIERTVPGRKKARARYAGMNTRKARLKDGMVIRMGEYNWWTRKPDGWDWFVNAIVATPNALKHHDTESVTNPAYGLMVGGVKTFGFYVKGVTNTFGMDAHYDIDHYNEYRGFIDKQKSTYWSVTGGGIVRLGCPIHLYGGAGYSRYNYYVHGTCDGWCNYTPRDTHGFSFDLGVMLRIKRVNIVAGCTFAPDFHGDDWNHAGNFGIGYSF